jgi:hypothetical protein
MLMNHPIGIKSNLTLKMEVKEGRQIQFSYRQGKNWVLLNQNPVDAGFLPPWDRALRVGLVSSGDRGSQSLFDNFELDND